MASLASTAAARAQIDALRDDLGFPDQALLDSFNATQKEQLLKLLAKKDALIGGSAVTLAKSLYTSKARFVFELLQNAEDNEYTRAKRNGEIPCVTFRIYPDRIVQECNEDGFNQANLRAICNIGKSSKSGSQNYIGEKGIGFKSVFMVAYKAYIQSGHLSFYFKHHPGEMGMGMIAPQWQEPTHDIGNRVTRITLYLHKALTEKELAEQNEMIRQQFESIHGAILLFMSKLKKINVVFYKENGTSEVEEKSIQFSAKSFSHSTAITKATNQNGAIHEEVKHYFTHTCIANNLARSENRAIQEGDDSYLRSYITLAFPLTANSEPLLEYQSVFAYLPTSEVGFKFLIQADFVTQANREGIVESSARNKSLIVPIAHAFIQSIQKMLDVPSLRFVWMRYLPKDDGFPWTALWRSLVVTIKDLLRKTPILQSLSSPQQLKQIQDSRRFRSLDLYNNNQPILRDSFPPLYISTLYQADDLQILESFGLAYQKANEVISRASYDLTLPDSRIRNLGDGAWQSAFIELLLYTWDHANESSKQNIQALNMFQTRSKEWVCSSETHIYFNTIEGTALHIPIGLYSNVLHSNVNQTGRQRQLYEQLGVTTATLLDVQMRIIRINQKFTLQGKLPALHLRFLYETHHMVEADHLFESIRIKDRDEIMRIPSSTRIYISDKSPYGAKMLLKPTSDGSCAGSGAPGREARFLHPTYLSVIPELPTNSSLSWQEWLHIQCNVQRVLPLINALGTDLSADGEYLIKYRPDKFFGYLKFVWASEKKRCTKEYEIIQKISSAEVACRRGNVQRLAPLNEAYLPNTKLLELANRFLSENEFFPFVELDDCLSLDTDLDEWRLLINDFGLGGQQVDMIEFLLTLIEAVIDSYYENGVKQNNPQRIYDFYLYLHAECMQSRDRHANCTKIRKSNIMDEIFIPGENEWDERALCVWEAPDGLELSTLYALSERYSSFFSDFESNKMSLQSFFVNTLQVAQECNWWDLVSEIKDVKKKEDETQPSFDRLCALYRCLSRFDLNLVDKTKLRNAFEENALICEISPRNHKWHKLSRCVWSHATNIPGMFAVNNGYEDLKGFFVDMLSVQHCTAAMLYRKLNGDLSKVSTREIEDTVEAFSTMLEIEEDVFDPGPVLRNKIFSVSSPNHESELCSTKTDFVIRDREALSDLFEGRAWFLEMSMQKVYRIKPFISWAGLENRYLSNAIKEICSLDFNLARPLWETRWQINEKAYALTRIAATFQSPRLDDGPTMLYNIFKSTKSFESSQITSQIALQQNNVSIQVEKEAAMLYIPDHASELKVYVTDDAAGQEGCFHSKLPRRLAQWIMSDYPRHLVDSPPSEMVNVIQSVLAVRRVGLAAVLEEHGILSVELEEDNDEVILPTLSTGGHSSISGPEHLSYESSSSETAGFVDVGEDNELPSDIPQSETRDVQQASSSLASGHNSVPLPRIIRLSEASNTSHTSYQQLLNHVVETGRRAVFPSHSVDIDENQAVHMSNQFDMRQYPKTERDTRIGAAGELWVYELLRGLHPALPEFTLANWQSTIRGFVSIHEDYSDIISWQGTETSDIVYQDNDQIFTKQLVEQGYLDHEVLDEPPIEYYIEVKTTTEQCSTAFYMSNAQYERMNRYSMLHPEFQARRKLYVIFRVYDISQQVRVKVLVDPKRLKDAGQLVFSTSTWSVVIPR